jgi:NADH-quinone oxidoreductase subunit K
VLDTQDLLTNYLILGGLLFGIGMLGFVARRNLIVMFLSVEMMLQGVSLTLVAFSRYHANWQGQVFTIFILAVAAAEAAIAMALILMLYRRRGSLDVVLWQGLREADLPPIADDQVPEPESEDTPKEYPRLTPAGVEPRSNGAERKPAPSPSETGSTDDGAPQPTVVVEPTRPAGP